MKQEESSTKEDKTTTVGEQLLFTFRLLSFVLVTVAVDGQLL